MKKINKKMKAYERKGSDIRKKIRRAECNAIVYAENLPGLNNGFGVYLKYGGQPQFLLSRHSGLLYNFLKSGVTLGELRRWEAGPGRKAHQLESQIHHLVDVVDEEIEAIIACANEGNPIVTTTSHLANAGSLIRCAEADLPLAA